MRALLKGAAALLRTAVLALVMVAGLTMGAPAQGTQRILLVHGLGSEGGGWATTESRLVVEFGSQQIAVARPNLSGLLSMEAQAQQLTGYFSAGDSAIAVAHSAGGVVSRTLDRRSDRQLKGVITLGTPHQGAPLSNNKVVALATIGSWIAQTADAPTYYFHHLQDGLAWLPWLEAAALVLPMAYYFDDLYAVFASQAAADVEAGGSFLQGAGGLNSASNLQREAASMPGRRLAIVNHTATFGQLCQMVFNTDWEGCVCVIGSLDLLYLSLFFYYLGYANPNDPMEYEKRANAYRWLLGADTFFNMNATWCGLIGAPGCDADGLIPAWSQRWPDEVPAREFFGAEAAQHSNQRESVLMQTTVVQLLVSQSDLVSPAPPPPPPPPPVLIVEIMGQATIAPNAQCQWWASVNGASGPITYAWFVNGVPIPNSDAAELTYGSPNPPFELAVSITATNGGASDTHYVAYDPEGWCQ